VFPHSGPVRSAAGRLQALFTVRTVKQAPPMSSRLAELTALNLEGTGTTSRCIFQNVGQQRPMEMSSEIRKGPA
jgi:hypothetical protein